MAGGEYVESRDVETTRDEKTATQTFRIYSVTTPQAALADTSLPLPGVDVFPGDASLRATTERRVTIVNGTRDVWDVVQTYRRIAINVDAGDGGQQRELLITRSGGFETMEKWVWRKPTAGQPFSTIFPSDKSNPAETDIGGTKVDIEGEPLSRPHKVRRVNFRQVFRGAPPFSLYERLQNYRNSVTWYTQPPGKVLYAGLSSFDEQPDGSWILVHSFISDEWFHLVQTPVRQEDGKPRMVDTTTTSGVVIRRAAEVWWQQPFPETANFALLGLGS